MVVCLLLLSLVSATQLRVTPEHPFYVNNSWVLAKQLVVGDKLTTIDGKMARISHIEEIKETVSVYNLEDELFHNYVSNGVIVHNSNFWISWFGKKPCVYNGIGKRKSGNVISNELFKKEAKELGVIAENTNGYRVDSRQPSEIFRTGGFFPNPQKAAGNLKEHVASGQNGVGNYVSATFIPGNSYVLRSPFFWKEQIINSGKIIVRDAIPSNLNELMPPLQFKNYQYAIQDSLGIKVPQTLGNDLEYEVVFNAVSYDKITEYRILTVTLKPVITPRIVNGKTEYWIYYSSLGDREVVVDISEWFVMPKQKVLTPSNLESCQCITSN